MDNLYIFPFIKRSSQGFMANDSTSKEDIEKLEHFYMQQLMQMFEHHGFVIDKKFHQDFNLAREAIKSALLRSTGNYHVLQDLVDTQVEENYLETTVKE